MNNQTDYSDTRCTESTDHTIDSDSRIPLEDDADEIDVAKNHRSLAEVLLSFSRPDPEGHDDTHSEDSQSFLEERMFLAVNSNDRLFSYSYWLLSAMVTAYDIASTEEQERNHEQITELLYEHAMYAIAGYIEYESLTKKDQDDLYTTKHEFLTYAWAFTKLWLRFALGDFGLRLMMAYEAEHSDFLNEFIQSFDQRFLNLRGYVNTLPRWSE